VHHATHKKSEDERPNEERAVCGVAQPCAVHSCSCWQLRWLLRLGWLWLRPTAAASGYIQRLHTCALWCCAQRAVCMALVSAAAALLFLLLLLFLFL
jgi:hypothetical protein